MAEMANSQIESAEQIGYREVGVVAGQDRAWTLKYGEI